MPEISRFYGIIILMYISDHNPPHFHIRYGEYKAIMTIESEILTGSLPLSVANKVAEWVSYHKDELLENWERLSHGEPPSKIEPLK